VIRKIKKIFLRDYFTNKVKIRSRRGLALLLRYRNYIDRKLVMYERYENQQIEFLIKLIELNRVDTFLDVGANFGLYALSIAGQCPRVSQILAFEPDVDNYYHLCGNIFVNGFSQKIKTYRLGISDRQGTVKFLKNAGSSSGTSRILETAPASTKNQRFDEVEIDISSLDILLPAFKAQTIALKIDVEGHEFKVFSGARRLLTDNRCLLQVEILDNAEQAVEAICAGYQMKCICNLGSDYYFSNFEIQGCELNGPQGRM